MTHGAAIRRTSPLLVAAILMAASFLVTYAIELRSLTHGRGTFHAEVDHYDEVPSHVAEKVIAAHRKELEAAGVHVAGGH